MVERRAEEERSGAEEERRGTRAASTRGARRGRAKSGVKDSRCGVDERELRVMPNGEELTERVKERHYGDDAAAERGGVENWSGVRTSGATSRAEATS